MLVNFFMFFLFFSHFDSKMKNVAKTMKNMNNNLFGNDSRTISLFLRYGMPEKLVTLITNKLILRSNLYRFYLQLQKMQYSFLRKNFTENPSWTWLNTKVYIYIQNKYRFCR